MTDLHRVLTEATEHVSSPDLAGRALAGAHRRRVRRAAAGALAAVVLAGGGVAWAVQDRAPRADVVDTPGPTPTPSQPDDALDLPTPPPVPDAAIQPLWDPRTVSDLPAGSVGLPASIVAPVEAPELTSMPPAVVMVDDPGGVVLADGSGAWHRLSDPEPPLRVPSYARTSRLSTDGTRVVFLGESALWSRDVRSTRWRRVDYPPGFLAPGDRTYARKVPVVLPLVAEHLWLQRDRTWFVDLDAATFEVRRATLLGTTWGGGTYVTTGTDPDYGLSVLRWGADPGAPSRSFRIDALETLSSIVNDSSSLAAVRGACIGDARPGEPSRRALVALDLDDLSTRAYLPVRDPLGLFTCGSGLQTLAWLGPDTVLFSAATQGGPASAERTLVTWDVRTGDLRRVGAAPADVAYDVAVGALAPVPEP